MSRYKVVSKKPGAVQSRQQAQLMNLEGKWGYLYSGGIFEECNE